MAAAGVGALVFQTKAVEACLGVERASGRSRVTPVMHTTDGATKLPKPSSVSRVAECCILQTCFHSPLLRFLLAFTRYMDYTHTMPTSHFYYVYILWDASTHTHFYVGHTSNLAARLKTHNAGHVPNTSKFAPWEIHSAIAVQTEEQASELEKYFKSHSGREWVIKHLGLPMGMTSLS